MSPITTHVLDTANGCPAQGVAITLEVQEGDQWTTLYEGSTNSDGRVTDLMQVGDLQAATYRITFHTQAYFAQQNAPVFYPYVPVTFQISSPTEHYHIPLLISPFGYSTYRGS